MGLFDGCPPDSGRFFKNVFDADTEMMVSAKKLCLELWEIYEPYADQHFVNEIRIDFSARFWEMDLTCFFLKNERKIECPKPGPDIKIDHQVWIEAISPTGGAEGNPNTVPDRVMGEVQQINGDLIALRYTAAIIEKHRKYVEYLEDGIIRENEAYIIAINSSQIPHAELDDLVPRIVKSVLAIGTEFVQFNRDTLEFLGSGHRHQAALTKPSGNDVPADIFLDSKYEGISAILYSNSDACNRAVIDGQGYILVHNPLARNPVEEGFLGVGREVIPTITNETEYSIRQISHGPA